MVHLGGISPPLLVVCGPHHAEVGFTALSVEDHHEQPSTRPHGFVRPSGQVPNVVVLDGFAGVGLPSSQAHTSGGGVKHSMVAGR